MDVVFMDMVLMFTTSQVLNHIEASTSLTIYKFFV